MFTPNPLPIDRCQQLVRLLGWTCGDCGADDEGGTGYRFICWRDDKAFVARGDSMEAGWIEALRLAGWVQAANDAAQLID